MVAEARRAETLGFLGGSPQPDSIVRGIQRRFRLRRRALGPGLEDRVELAGMCPQLIEPRLDRPQRLDRELGQRRLERAEALPCESRQHLLAQGFTEAASPRDASLVVTLDYGVDNGQTKVRTTPGLGFGYGSYGGYGFHRPYYSRFGGFYGRRNPFYYGWYDPFFDSGFGYPEVTSYTVYTSFVDMDIKRTADGQSVFEGTAKARSGTDQLQVLVPNLIEALFTGFPGNSGETVRITVPNEPRRR